MTRWILFPVALAALVQITRDVYHYPQQWMVDLAVYRDAGTAALHGHDPYAIQSGMSKLSYLYPPIDVIFLAPLVFVSLPAAALIWNSINIAALEWIISSSWLRAKLPHAVAWSVPLTVAAVLLNPVDQTLEVGQLSIVLVALVLADLDLAESSRLKGILVGLATGIKILPGAFVVYYLLRRQWRAAATATLTTIATAVIGFLAFPAFSVAFWTKHFWESSDRMLPVHWVPNESIRGTLSRMLHSDSAAVLPWMLTSVVVVAVAATIILLGKHDNPDHLGVSACALTMLLVEPVSWHHYWVWIIPVTIHLAVVAYRSRNRVLLSCTAISFVIIAIRVNRWFVPPYDGYDALHLSEVQLLGIDIVTFSTILLLASIFGYAVQRSRPSGSSQRSPAGLSPQGQT
ncbi:glycosyltransferase 87 family protein [Amycolatopsis pigmentata]